MQMSVTFANLKAFALCLGMAVTVVASSAPFAQAETVKENPTVAKVPGDTPATAAPNLLTPEMSDQGAFDQAVAADSSAALIMFLARNPDTVQAPEARQLLAARKTPDSRMVTQSVAGGDADVVGAFDAARLAGTAEGWDAFMALHGGHPLSAQVQYFKP